MAWRDDVACIVAVAGQSKPAEANGNASQDKAQVPSEDQEATAPTHQQPPATRQPAPAQGQAQASAPAAQSALARDPARAQNAVHPGNGNTQVSQTSSSCDVPMCPQLPAFPFRLI